MSPVEYHDLLRVPFADGGRTPETGFDCWGLVRFLLKRMGHDVPEMPYSSAHNATEVEALIEAERWNRAQEVTDNDVGAVVVIRNAPRQVNHVGLIVEPGRFIHVLTNTGVVTERTDRPPWSRRIMGFYRWPIKL